MSSAIKNPSILIGEKTFLNNFTPDFLATCDILLWEKKYGSKNLLDRVKDEHLFSLFVESEISYSKDNLVCWLSKIVRGGYLCLEVVRDKYNPLVMASQLSSLAELIETPNENVWVFRKKENIPSYKTLYLNIVKALLENKPDVQLWQYLDEFEMYYPTQVMPTYIKSMRMIEKNMAHLVQDYWHRFLGISPSISMNIFYSLMQLNSEGYESGFKARERLLGQMYSRRSKYVPTLEIIPKRWKGESIKNKTFVIWTEFGLGDEIMFAQLAHFLKIRGVKKIILIAQAPIVSILKTHPDIDLVLSAKEIDKALPNFDYWAYPHEILAYVPVPFSDIPKRIPYLSAEPKKVSKYATLFKENDKLKVGFAWKGDPSHENDHFRSIHDIETVEKIFQIEGIDWYCMQKVCNAEEIALLEKYNIPHITRDFTDFSETAAAMTHLDLFIAVDTSLIHLAGAMNIPSLVLLPYIVDWRWELTGRYNYWYPSVKSIRNKAPIRDWDNVLDELKMALKPYLSLN